MKRVDKTIMKLALAIIPATIFVGLLAFGILWVLHRDTGFAGRVSLFVTLTTYVYFFS